MRYRNSSSEIQRPLVEWPIALLMVGGGVAVAVYAIFESSWSEAVQDRVGPLVIVAGIVIFLRLVKKG